MAARNDDFMDDLPAGVADPWIDFRRSLIRRGRRAGTVSVYAKSYRTFWRWALADGVPADPAAVDYRVLNRWLDHLLVSVATRNGRPVLVVDPDTGEHVPKGLEASTRRILWTNLRPFFSWWSSEEGTDSPYDRADTPEPDRAPAVPLVPLDEIRAVLATCANLHDFTDARDNALIRLLIDTGARRGELVSIALSDWDKRYDLLSLDGKTGPRVVPVSLTSAEALSRYIKRRAEHRYANLPAMWLGPKGPLGDSGIATALARRCEMAGVPRINPHKLRHTWAHTFRAEGGSEGDLLYLAGWSSTAMAHRYGKSAAAERAQQAARRISVGDRL